VENETRDDLTATPDGQQRDPTPDADAILEALDREVREDAAPRHRGFSDPGQVLEGRGMPVRPHTQQLRAVLVYA
jgi:hypothetical protein